MAPNARMVDVIDQFAAEQGIAVATPVDDEAVSQTLNRTLIEQRWASLEAAGIERPGLAFGEWVDLMMVGGVLPPLLANCENVGVLLDALVKFHPLWGDDEVVLKPLPGGVMAITLQGPNGTDVHPHTVDAFFTTLTRMLATLTRPPLRARTLILRTPMVAQHRRLARRVHDRGTHDALEFSAADLATPIVFADPSVHVVLTRYAESAINERGQSFADRVRRELRRDLAGPPRLATVAAQLHVSTRLLQQRLAEDGEGFAALLDAERQAQALALLADPDTSVSTAARLCGFDSIEGFSRAMRRWTGSSPSEWRRRSV